MVKILKGIYHLLYICPLSSTPQFNMSMSSSSFLSLDQVQSLMTLKISSFMVKALKETDRPWYIYLSSSPQQLMNIHVIILIFIIRPSRIPCAEQDKAFCGRGIETEGSSFVHLSTIVKTSTHQGPCHHRHFCR